MYTSSKTQRNEMKAHSMNPNGGNATKPRTWGGYIQYPPLNMVNVYSIPTNAHHSRPRHYSPVTAAPSIGTRLMTQLLSHTANKERGTHANI